VTAIRVGQGFDIHRFSDDPERSLVLGGVIVRESKGLAGHSDADVVTHALCDAVLGAAALGDLGMHFPDTDSRWAGASSLDLLRRVVEMVATRGLEPQNADCTIVCDKPRLGEVTSVMAQNLTAALGAPVSVKAKRAEGLGALGRAEGIVAMAVVLLDTAHTDELR
jgi:2-C-methyl-D-erythritol 2,4-cyclodiphosphate synthase